MAKHTVHHRNVAFSSLSAAQQRRYLEAYKAMHERRAKRNRRGQQMELAL